MSCLICLTALYEEQKSCLFLKAHVFSSLVNELLSSFDHLKSLSTWRGKQQSPFRNKNPIPVEGDGVTVRTVTSWT